MHTISTVSIALYIYLYFLWAWRLYTIMIIIYDTIAHLKLSVRSRAIFLWELCEIDAIEMKRRKSIITIISNVRAYICIWLINSADYIASRTWNRTGRRANAFSHCIFFCFFLWNFLASLSTWSIVNLSNVLAFARFPTLSSLFSLVGPQLFVSH